MANFMRANIELGFEAFERFPKEERDLSSMTISINPKTLPLIREELAALRKKVLEITNKDPEPKNVYLCNIQLFPATR